MKPYMYSDSGWYDNAAEKGHNVTFTQYGHSPALSAVELALNRGHHLCLVAHLCLCHLHMLLSMLLYVVSWF